MAEWGELKCRGCGAQEYKALSSTELECVYCGLRIAESGQLVKRTVADILTAIPKGLAQKVMILIDARQHAVPTAIQRLTEQQER